MDPIFAKRNLENYSLEFSYTFDEDREEMSFASCFPYSYDNMQKDTERWNRRLRKVKGVSFKKNLLCFTLSGRKVYFFACYKNTDQTKIRQLKNRKIIFLTARSKPSDSNSSHVLHDFMMFLTDKKRPEAQYLL